MSFSDEIDFELLITAVKKNDCTWNYKLKEYSNKTIKNRAWMAVCEEVISDFNNKPINEKNAIVIDVQSKWKTLRDGFTRYCRNLKKKSRAPGFTPKPYTYYDQLLFLKDVNEDRDQNVDSQQTCPPLTDQSTDEDSVKKRPRKHHTDSDDVLIETLTMRLNDKRQKAERPPSPPPDEDKLFLLSLLSDFKKIPDDWKLDAKGEIIQVIRNYRTMQNYNSITIPSTSQSWEWERERRRDREWKCERTGGCSGSGGESESGEVRSEKGS